MNRFNTPVQGREVCNEYDIPSDEIQDLIARSVSPLQVYTDINLAVAGTKSIDVPGYGFVLYAINVATGRKYSEVFCNVAVNRGDLTDAKVIFPAKGGRGFRGAFSRLFLSWPADLSATYQVYFIVFKSREYPWVGGEEAS